MIQLPPDFNVGQLFSELFGFAAPAAGVAFLLAAAFLIATVIRRAR